MSEKLLKNIESWKEEDLINLPAEEDDFFEYKSSKIITKTFKELKNEISKAASAFLNSGGGIFIAGVDKKGKIDGGIPKNINRQPLRDWVDQVISTTVNPFGVYRINIIERDKKNSLIDEDKVVLIIIFNSSFEIHMAYDHKYYIRAGAHSNSANHFLVEAIRARRGLQKPLLRGILRFCDRKPNVVQLVILALNNLAALNIKTSFNPMPRAFEEHYKDKFPLNIPAIDNSNPFIMDLFVFGIKSKTFGDNPVNLILEYNDIVGNKFKYKQIIDPSLNLGPMLIGPEILEKIKDSLAKIEKSLSNIDRNMSK